jgi:N-acetyl-gamma-glutamyl-phosphate/LysW-gamma-L-alpha-aminoadipyl-6-phosphate reductase
LKVSIVGGSGFTGGELLRILATHPNVEIKIVTSRKYVGEYVHRVHPNLRGILDIQFTDPSTSKIAEESDVVFLCTPAGVSAKITPEFLEAGVKVIDLSPDFRLKDPKEYERWYGWKHPRPDLLEKAVYGLPELHREEIRKADLVACPGCMSTAAILAMAPLAKANFIKQSVVVVDAMIGSSGAGATPSLASIHAERYGVIRPYKPVGHRHTGEIEQELSVLAGGDVKVAFSASSVNIVRGILVVCHCFTEKTVTIRDLWKIYRQFYGNEPFIRLVRDVKGIFRYPDPKPIVGSNFCDVGFELDQHTNRIVALSAIDNLVKGAVGNAVQSLNLIYGLDERTGLMYPGIHPV